MHRVLAYRPSPAMVVALVALFVSLGGSAYAALALPKNSVGTKQLKRGAVTSAKLRNHAVTSLKVKNHSLLAKDFAAGQLPRGPQGTPGPQGPPGPQGTPGPSTGPAGGALSGSYPDPSLHVSGGDSGASACQAGQALVGVSPLAALSCAGVSPSGAAGGDLTGSYPDPSIAPGAVTTSKLGTIPAASVFCGIGPQACNSVPTGNIDTALQFTGASFDSDNLYSATADTELTAPIAGIYQVEGYIVFPPNSGLGLRFVGIGTPSSCCIGIEQLGSGTISSSDNTILSTSALVHLSAGGSVVLDATQTSGSAMTPYGASLAMFWVGP